MILKFKSVFITAVIIFMLIIPSVSSADKLSDSVISQEKTQYKNGYGFSNDIDAAHLSISQNSDKIRLSSTSHYENTEVKIPWSDIENLDGFNGLVRVVHYNDDGIADWAKLMNPKNVDGYWIVELDFSAVEITVGESQVNNWNLETWSGGTTDQPPTGWSTTVAASTDRSTSHKIGSYSCRFTESAGTTNIVYQDVASLLEPDSTYRLGYWLYIPETFTSPSDYLQVYLRTFTPDGTLTSTTYSNANGGWVYYEQDFTTDSSVPGSVLLRFLLQTDETDWTVYIDGVTISKIDGTITADENFDDENIYLNFSYNIQSSDVDNIIVTRFEDIDITENGRLGMSTYLRGSTPVTGYRGDNMLYIETGGATGIYTIYVTIPYGLSPTQIDPAPGENVDFNYPPLMGYLTFEWSSTGTTTKLQVAQDTAFNNIVYETETTGTTATAQLPEGTYFWRVASYNRFYSTYGSWSSTRTVHQNAVYSGSAGTGVAGTVYESLGLGDFLYIDGAVVTLYNDTFTTQQTTGSSGYYEILNLTSGTYFLYAQAKDYDQSTVAAINVTAGNISIQNLVMLPTTDYYQPHFVQFVVKTSGMLNTGAFSTIIEGANVTAYRGDSESVYDAQTTGSDGSVGFAMDENTRYRLETEYHGETQIDYISPVDTLYYIIWDPQENSLTPESQFYDVVNISVSKTDNGTCGNIYLIYEDPAVATNYVYAEIGQYNNTGNFVQLENSTVRYGNTTFYFCVSPYQGQDFALLLHANHDDFGNITKAYTVSFPSSSLPFEGKGTAYLCIFLLFIVAAMFGKADAHIGAMFLCGLASVFWYADVFASFGSTTNSYIFAGILLAVCYTVLMIFNRKRDEGGI